jgi:hypothetical protein
MKRTALALTIIFALSFSAVAGGLSLNRATANPAPLFAFFRDPVTTLPTIVVHSPVQNQIYNSTSVWLNFSIIKPESWFAFNVGAHADGSPLTETFVNITSVYCLVDGRLQSIQFHDIDSLFDTPPTLTLNFSTALPLVAGEHTVKVSCEATSYYLRMLKSIYQGGYDWANSVESVELHADSETVNFTKELFIEVHLPANKTFDTSSIPLNFTVDEPVSQVTYSLDGQENVTVSGNATLTGLSNGEHNVTVYARDEAGNVGSSETTSFTVVNSEPFPTLLVAVTFGVVAAVLVAVAALVYWKKRKREVDLVKNP